MFLGRGQWPHANQRPNKGVCAPREPAARSRHATPRCQRHGHAAPHPGASATRQVLLLHLPAPCRGPAHSRSCRGLWPGAPAPALGGGHEAPFSLCTVRLETWVKYEAPLRSAREDKDVREVTPLRGNGGEGTERGGDTWVPGAIAPRPALRRRKEDPSVDGGVSSRLLQRPRVPRRPPRSRVASPARAQRPPLLRFTAANSAGEPDGPVIIPYSSHRQHADLSS